MHVIGSPVEILVGTDATEQEIEETIIRLGLDKPFHIQYWHFLTAILQGDFGKSFLQDVSAMTLIFERMPATMELALGGLLLSIVIGIPLGLYSGIHPNTRLSKTIMAGSILGFSVPNFWIGLMFILVFSVNLGWFPSTGRGDTELLFGIEWSFLTLDGLSHLLLPVVTLASTNVALTLRLTRAGVMENMRKDYIKFAQAKGLSTNRIVFVHLLKNILPPTVTVLGIEFGNLIAFAVVTETVFAWPGMGKLIIDSIMVLDRPVVVAYMIIVVVIFVSINLVVDILYIFLDPRVKLGSKPDGV
jgi:peptide/nickel transport system permease protein